MSQRMVCLARCLTGSVLWALLPMAVNAQGSVPWQLSVSDVSQTTLVEVELSGEGEWCLVWNHSVQGFPVTDCFRMQKGQLMLDTTHTPDFAAGLGHISGRGRLVSDDTHGYRIVEMQVPISNNHLWLRVGAPSVNHRIEVGARLVSLSDLAADQLVEIRVQPAGGKGNELK